MSNTRLERGKLLRNYCRSRREMVLTGQRIINELFRNGHILDIFLR